MIRAWAGIALLAASWLAGLSYYQPADPHLWRVLVVLGSLLLAGSVPRAPARWAALIALALLMPALWLMPWPYRAASIALAAGLAVAALPLPARERAWLAGAGVASGVILLIQSLAISVYASLTARSHDLPDVLTKMLAGVASLLGLDAAASGPHIALHTMRRVHMLGATWELLLDPPSLCLLVGGAALLGLRASTLAREQRPVQTWLRSTLVLLACLAVWLPVRAGLLMAVFIHRAMLTDYEADINLMNQFWTPWVHLVLLSVPTLLAWRFVRAPAGTEISACAAAAVQTGRRRRVGAVVLAGLASATVHAALTWDPIGQRKDSRLLVDECHSDWERTDRPFDTEWYGHMSGYNYACIYDYLSRFYEMGRLAAPITDTALSSCDVLVLKTPTKSYAAAEVAAIGRFVEKGGGLLLVGEHTNVFGTGTYLNEVAREFGFSFRYDCLFGIDKPFDQLYVPPAVPHPVVQHMPPMDFAVSCSIEPGQSWGRAVMRSTGLKNLPADYHASNFYPQVTDRAEARYGSFVQLWGVSRGKGRVLAFTDSTIFSNFSTFEPGKAELMIGMIEWLNQSNRLPDPRAWLIPLGIGLAAVSLMLRRNWADGWPLLTGAAIFGFLLGGQVVGLAQRRAMPVPEARLPMVRVVIDRTLCDGPLSKGGFITGATDGFGIFERWILRLGYFNRRAIGAEVLDGNLVVFMYPRLAVTDEFRGHVARYVEEGGHILVLDSPENSGSTAGRLLEPFGLQIDRDSRLTGELVAPEGWPSGVQVSAAHPVVGGTPIIRIDGQPVAAQMPHGRGTVTVLGFASRFTDAQMGITGDVEPTPEQRSVYDLQFALLRWIVEGAEPSLQPASHPVAGDDEPAHLDPVGVP